MLSQEVFAEGMTLLGETYERDITEILLKAYYRVLQNVSDSDFQNAVGAILATRQYTKMPLPADILEHINGKPEDQALLALDKVEKAIREVGGYTSVIFDDPVIHRVINSFHDGWVGICEMTLEEWKWARKDFLKMYQAFQQQPDMQTPVKLYGRHDLHNETHGYITSGRVQECLTYIGNEQKARSWIDKQIALDNNTKQLTDSIKEVAHVSCS